VSVGRNILKLIFSRIGAQVITLLTAPILTRLFDVSDFGIRQVFTSILTTLAVICSLRYEFSIPLSKDKRQAASSFILSILIITVFSTLLLVLVPLLKGKVAEWYEMPELNVFLWLIPVFVLIQGIDLALRNWAAYERKFGAIAWASFGGALGQRPVSLVWALLLGATVTGLFVGAFGHIAVPLFILLYFCSRSIKETFLQNKINFKDLWETAKFHKKFPIFNSWTAFLNNFSKQLPVFILGLYFPENVIGYSVLGYYFLAKNIVSLPMRFVTVAVQQVYYPTAAASYASTGNVSKITSDVFKRLVQIGVFPMLVLALLGGPLFRLVFGEKWHEAGIYVQILAPWLLFTFISTSWGTVFLIFGLQGTSLILTIIRIIVSAASLLIGSKFFSPRIALGIFVASDILYMCLHMLIRFKLTKVSILWAVNKVFKYILFSVLIILPVKALSYYVLDWVVVLLTIIVGGIYITVLLYADASLRRFILKIFKKQESEKNTAEED
jgi:O-antigen/teichoic acid export membrane protein